MEEEFIGRDKVKKSIFGDLEFKARYQASKIQ